jgi:glyoxylase-like metal-dependent hydrolase (beta-lactamase superfamily II)
MPSERACHVTEGIGTARSSLLARIADGVTLASMRLIPMRIHHLNCVSACPVGGFLLDEMSRRSLRGRLVSHCLLLETEAGLVLIDTGYGLRDVHEPRSRLAKPMLALMRPELREEMTAVRQIAQLGFDPNDVRHIVLSHLDFDHAGGLDDFPQARVHLSAHEVHAAVDRRTLIDRMRYRPQQWSTRPNWCEHSVSDGEPWYGFERVCELGLGPEILLVPLVGHTLGHAGIALRYEHGWLLYAGDAYFFHAEMDVEHPHCTPGLEAYQTMMEKDRTLRLDNQRRLRELKQQHGHEIQIFCAHDVHEFEQLSGRSHSLSAGALMQPRAA